MMAVRDGFTWKTAYILLGLLFLLLVLRAFFGMDSTDESFYFALARRFWQGDTLLVDEWFPAQMIGALLLPFYKAYVFISGGEEGVILAARLLYAAFAILTAAYMMRVFGRRGESASFSFLSSLIFAVYVRAGIATFSYYNLGLLAFLLALLFLLDAEHVRAPQAKWCMAGISFGVSVLCMPYMVLLFAGMAVCYFFRRGSLSVGKDGLFFMLGVLLAAGTFLASFGKGILLGLANVPYLFMDPLHQGSVFEKTGGTVWYILFVYLKYTWPVYAASFPAAVFARKITVRRPAVRMCFRVFLYVEFFVQAAYSRTFFEGGIVCAFLLLALQLQLLEPEARDRKLELFFLLPGLLFGLIWANGSDLGMRVCNMGFCLADVWALKVLERDLGPGQRGFRFLGALAVLLLFAVLFVNRFFDIYRDSPLWELDTRISCGSMKGIYTSAGRAKEYEAAVRELRLYTGPDDRIAAPELNPWVYLEAPARCGAFQVWKVDFTDKRNEVYYRKNPQNTPNILYLPYMGQTEYEGFAWGSHGSFTQAKGVEKAEGFLEKLLEDNEYETVRAEKGIFYRLVK